MSTASISSVISDLFNAPLQAAVKADAEYLKIWAQWLEFKKPLFLDENGALFPGVDINTILETAPVVNLNGKIDLAITMRITDVKEKNASLSGGLSVGPIFASGSFGFHRQQSEESLFQAAGSFVLSNQEKSLSRFLSEHAIMPTNAGDVDNVIEQLKSTAAKLEGPAQNAAQAQG